MIARYRARQLKDMLPRLMTTAVIVSLIVLVALISSAPSRTVQAQSTSMPEKTSPDREAKAAFQGRCSFCHGERGEGSDVGMSLGVPDLHSLAVQKQSDAALKTILREGKGNMPAFGKSYSDATLDALIGIIRRFGDPPSASH